MKTRPILFSGPMVLALLDDTKTQTRRVVKPPPSEAGLEWFETPEGFAAWQDPYLTLDEHSEDGGPCQRVCPYGDILTQEPNPLLWVRETWMPVFTPSTMMSPGRCGIKYKADDEFLPGDTRDSWDYTRVGKWRPSIFMPRWASRITLEVTEVRVERVQDIGIYDIEAEGLDVREDIISYNQECDAVAQGYNERPEDFERLARNKFQALWDSINGKKYPWESNPWVWVVTFKRIEK